MRSIEPRACQPRASGAARPRCEQPATLLRRRLRAPLATAAFVLAIVPGCSESETAVCSGDWLDGVTELIAQDELRTAGSLVASSHEDLIPIARAVDRYHRAQAVPEDDPRPCYDTFEAEVTYVLVMSELAGRPDLASPELLAALRQAGEDDGMHGIFNMVAGTDDDGVGLVVHPGLDALQDLVLPLGGDAVARERDLRERIEAGDD